MSTKIASIIIVIFPPITVANQPTTTYPNGNKANEPNISRLATLPKASYGTSSCKLVSQISPNIIIPNPSIAINPIKAGAQETKGIINNAIPLIKTPPYASNPLLCHRCLPPKISAAITAPAPGKQPYLSHTRKLQNDDEH